MTSNCLVLGMHRRRSNPPHPSSFGNAEISRSRNSCPDQLMSGMTNFFSPKPAWTNASRSVMLQGTRVPSLLARHTTFIVQLCPLVPTIDFFGRLYGAKFVFCSAETSLDEPIRLLKERIVSSARLQEAVSRSLTPGGKGHDSFLKRYHNYCANMQYSQ